MGVKTDRQLMNEDRRLLAQIGISPNPNLSDQKDVIAEVKKLKEDAVKKGLISVDKNTGQAVANTGTVIKVAEEEAESENEKKDSKR